MSLLTALFLAEKRKFFLPQDIYHIQAKLESLDNTKQLILMNLDYKDPAMVSLISFFFGYWGADRFYIGDYLLGVLKCITLGGCGIWWLVDWFCIASATKRQNNKLFQSYVL